MQPTPSNSEPQTADYPDSPDGAVAPGQLAKPALDFLTPAQQPDELGRLGSYRILKILGKGGMGMVFLAEDTKLDRLVALKVMLPKYAEDAAAKQRFLREAKMAAKIEHDHIVHIYQVDEDRGVPFLAMQLLAGCSLEDVLRRAGRLTVPQILHLGAQIAEGLAVAHAKGLIHRDIKPANIWIEADHGARIKLLDFGLARSVQTDIGITQSGMILGTPAYMPPEQARGEQVDQRCDLYSLGCVLYRMATGELPIKGKNTMGLLMALALEQPTRPRQINDAIPEVLNDLIMQLLAKDAAQRPESAKTVAQALKKIEQEFVQTAQQSDVTSELIALVQSAVPAEPAWPAVAANPALPTVSATGGTALAEARATQRIPRRRFGKRVMVAAGLLVLLAAGLSALFLLRTPPENSGEQWALEFDGKASYVELPPMPFDPKKGLTLEAYVLPLPGAQDQEIIMADDERWGFGLTLRDNGKALVFGAALTSDQKGLKAKKKWFGVTSKWEFHPATWTHLTAVFDGKTIRLFQDGRQVETYTTTYSDDKAENWLTWKVFPGFAHPPSTPTFLGGQYRSFKGRVSSVRISNGPRYQSDFTPQKRFEADEDTLGLYHFDEGQGDKLTDSSGNGRHGKIVGANWVKVDPSPRAPAPTEWALEFDGKASYVELPPMPFDPKKGLTLEAFVLPLESDKSQQIIGSVGLNYAGGFGLAVHNTDEMEKALGEPVGFGAGILSDAAKPRWYTAGSKAKLPWGVWTHLAAVFDGKTIRLFRDGRAVTQYNSAHLEGTTYNIHPGNPKGAVFPGLARPPAAPTLIGKDPWFFKGQIAAVRISNGPRYQNDFTPQNRFKADQDTLGLYHFDEGEGDKLTDSSGNKRHGKIVGAKWVKPDKISDLAAPARPRAFYSLSFDGVKDYVEVLSLRTNSGHPLTIEGWLQTSSGATKSFLAMAGADFGLSIFSADFRIAKHYTRGEQVWAAGQTKGHELKDYSKPVHFAGVWDGSEVRVYVNGKRSTFSEVKKNPEWKGDRQSLHLGGHLPDNLFKGTLHEVRISKVARYSEDFTPSPRFQADPHTLALYHFDEGQGEKLIDSSGNGHHGKIVGAKWVKVADAAATSVLEENRALAEWALKVGGDVLFDWQKLKPVEVRTMALPYVHLDFNWVRFPEAELMSQISKGKVVGVNLLTWKLSEKGWKQIAALPELKGLGGLPIRIVTTRRSPCSAS